MNSADEVVRVARDRAHQAIGDAAIAADNNYGVVSAVRAHEATVHSNLAIAEEVELLRDEAAKITGLLARIAAALEARS